MRAATDNAATGGAAADGRRPGGPETAPAEAELWARFAQPDDGAQFLHAWLSLLARALPGCTLAAVLLRQPDGGYVPAATFSATESDPARVDATALGAVCESALAQGRGAVRRVEAGAHLALPVADRKGARALIAVALASHPGARLAAIFQQMLWAAGWLLSLEQGEARQAGEARTARAQAVLQALAALVDERRPMAALIAFVNELAARFEADRVSLSLLGPGPGAARPKLVALSQTASFRRRTALVRAIEMAQAEAASQLGAIFVPAPEGERRGIDVAHRLLGRQHGAVAMASLHLRDEGRTFGVVTLERMARGTDPAASGAVLPEVPRAFDAPTRESLALVAALAGPLVAMKRREQRWLSGRLRDGMHRFLARLLGEGHPGLKLASLAGVALGAWLALATVPLRITAEASLEGTVQRTVAAPFAGFLAEAPVRAGERVAEGALLARLDDRDLAFERLKWVSEQAKADQRQREALARGDRSGVLVAIAQAQQAAAELALVDEKLQRTRLVAPLGGLVVSGDFSQMLGSPVEQGKVLFEITPLDALRVVLQVREADFALLAARHDAGLALTGDLTLTGEASRALPFRITLLTPVASVRDGVNGFRVEALLVGGADGQRPGMQGVAKIALGETSLLHAWTRETVNRLRLLAWRWMP